MRFDLPSAAETDEIDRIAATLIGMVCRLPDADAVAAVAYTDDAFADDGMPHRDLIAGLERRADACGIRVSDALSLPPTRGGRTSTRPARLMAAPSTSSPTSREGAEHLDVAEGDQSAGAELPRVDLAVKERTARALSALEDAVLLLCGPESASPPCPRRDLFR